MSIRERVVWTQCAGRPGEHPLHLCHAITLAARLAGAGGEEEGGGEGVSTPGPGLAV